MNTYITLACLLAVAASAHGSGYGLGGYGGWGGWGGYGPILAPAAVSTQNVYKAAPIPIIKSVAVAPIITPIVKTVPIAVSYGGLGGLGGLGYGGLGYGGLGYGGLGYGGYGLGKGLGYGLGWGKH